MEPNRSPKHVGDTDNDKPDKEQIPVDESDFDAPGIAPTKPSSMPRGEDDQKTWRRSPEYHDRK